ncbi:NAD(P)(+) transhydrogenase [Solemya pervernicosa gill symbiont]|uniref:Soluble pyridine nucleotide transhydrogenase n=2 Tax=Gammaproteobacteria incertae sedis TaxID=118884 RepID=A0A1T2L1R8_9GAMM|nr:Si-specific NAD(P)(+) transhydrogenase [Candidatus Reidiella endopervernicosa]OOZ39022.1 NAD(P)(+) transhydrogenase [Solemya pervernicosa gill symbiont]QKQ26913.1 Si-specific NAD(P)(+) transhydrogenase [Candidatus Reidiella endopervernicosa]
MSKQFDTIIIGSGPGGEGAAMTLAKKGRSVAVVEKAPVVGGSCTHSGTIPSKALRHEVQLIQDYKQNELFAGAMEHLEITWPQLLERSDEVISRQTRMRRSFYDCNRVPVIQGHACFISANEIQVTSNDGSIERYSADHFIIATGSRPYRPDDIDFSHPRVLDSDALMNLDCTPRSITVYGAGVIGCEYASIFANLDIKVNLVNTRERLLAFLDDEITDALSYHLRSQGVILRHNEEYESVETTDDGVIMTFSSGKRLKTDLLLWANGRSGNTQDMGLEEIGIDVNHRGSISINEDYQTALPHIYAIGDVVGWPSLASASYDQGRFAATHIAEGVSESKLIEDIPTGIYTNPEISSVGRTERELTDDKVPYEVGRSIFENLARSHITGSNIGMLKILFHRESLEILGIHCFGHQASEIVHIGQAIMSQKGSANTVRYFVDTTFNYPTMAEAYRVAALDGLNRIF